MNTYLNRTIRSQFASIPFLKPLFAFCLSLASINGVMAQEITGMHPSFTRQSILPSALNNIGGIGGIALLPNGDGIILGWGGSQKSNGEVWIIPNLSSGVPGTPVRITSGMREPLGVTVVGNDFYVLEKPRINKYVGSGTTWTRSTVWSLPTAWYNDGQWHHFSWNMIYKENALWFTTGTAWTYDVNDPLERGALIRVPINGGSYTQFARGLRNPSGLGLGPNNEFFASDNEGNWKPADYFYYIPTKDIPTNGRFYGFRTNTNNACKITAPNQPASLPPATAACPSDREYPPAVWLPYSGGALSSNLSNSPTRPLLIPSGPYAGQMLVGDVRAGNIYRIFLEKIGGEYQGAVIRFAAPGSLSSGILQMMWLPGGKLLAAGIGGGTCGLDGSGNWNYDGKCRGLDLLSPTNVTPFEILAVRSVPRGFELEFTQTPNAAAAAAISNYTIRARVLTAIQEYGRDGNTSDDNVAITIDSAIVTGNKVRLVVKPLVTSRFYYFQLGNSIVSATSSAPLRARDAWYTLNTQQIPSAIADARTQKKNHQLKIVRKNNELSIELPLRKTYRMVLFRLDGSQIADKAK